MAADFSLDTKGVVRLEGKCLLNVEYCVASLLSCEGEAYKLSDVGAVQPIRPEPGL